MDSVRREDNKRKHRRFTVDLMDIQSSAVFTSEAMIRDMSITGAALITDRQLKTGSEYSIRLLDDTLDITLMATVVWSSENVSEGCDAENAPPHYLAGLRFQHISQSVLEDLEKFLKFHHIKRHAKVNVNQLSGIRYNVRFRVDKHETTLLNVTENYKVKKLSLRGMLIESGHAFEPETRFHMELTMPGSGNLSFTGRVASCLPSEENPDSFDAGIEFVHMPDEDRARLKALIKELYIKDAGF